MDRTVGRSILVTTLVVSGMVLATAAKVMAEERQFLVMLATSPKQVNDAGGGQLQSPEAIRKQYFDRTDDDINSFAEYWEELSYGDVTVSGDVTGWINLPWPITPPDPVLIQIAGGGQGEVAEGEEYFFQDMTRYGESEELVDPTHFTERGREVYKPGERFIDLNGNGQWDSVDEVLNLRDDDDPGACGYGQPDQDHAWVDFNNNGFPDNEPNCVAWVDRDNDRNPDDCCPNGPGTCDPATPCPPTLGDCNGNLVPDFCDLLTEASPLCPIFGGSRDELPFDENSQPSPDGFPDECQFVEGVVGGGTCFQDAGEEGNPVCTEIPGFVESDSLPPYCECVDSDGDGCCESPEPWEDFLMRYEGFNVESSAERPYGPDSNWVKVSEQYIRWNYPAREEDIEALIAQSTETQILFGDHGAEGTCSDGCAAGPAGDTCRIDMYDLADDFAFPCVTPCADTDPCIVTEQICPCMPFYCVAGIELGNYDPPTDWMEGTPSPPGDNSGIIPSAPLPGTDEFARNQKMLIDPDVVLAVNFRDILTPRPGTRSVPCEGGSVPLDEPWYEEWWRDRYTGEDENDPRTQPHDPPFWRYINTRIVQQYDVTQLRPFAPNKGGIDGAGTIDFNGDCPQGTLIYPEQARDGAIDYFDGWVEFDDLASSKYHRTGDLRLGEVTATRPRAGTDSRWDVDEIFGPEYIWASDVMGEDRASGCPGEPAIPDAFIPAAGPYAQNIHGNGNFDAGNVAATEMQTWRQNPPWNDGTAWETEMDFNGYYRDHPYAGPIFGMNYGFRDYNLDGLIDQGYTRRPGTENYILDEPYLVGTPRPRSYPFNKARLVEDCVEVIDRLLDFDDFVDRGALEVVNRNSGNVYTNVPNNYVNTGAPSIMTPDGLLSGIVLIPSLEGTFTDTVDLPTRTWLEPPDFVAIHNDDNDNPEKNLSQTGDFSISWNLFFHTLVRQVDDLTEAFLPNCAPFQIDTAAFAYGRVWQGWPFMFDPDARSNPNQENSPVGQWDQMANGCLVHTNPLFKEAPGTEWIESIDFKTVLTPGVTATVTLPSYEFVRDRNSYFIENPTSPGERYYFYSVGEGFDGGNGDLPGMPGDGVLILHTDVGANPESLPNGQQNGTRFAYAVVQADGLDQLGAPEGSGEFNRGDDGDIWPGDTNKRTFDFDTTPSATWYAQESWTGLDVSDIRLDGNGSASIEITWTPTSIPSLSFVDPPGGASAGGVYTIRFDATDVRGGTTIEIYSTRADHYTSIDDQANDVTLIDSLDKVNPGTRRLSMDWDISGLEDGLYYLFAKLIPGEGADGVVEASYSTPIPGRNNKGEGELTVQEVNIDRDKARLEVWTMRLVDTLPDGTQDWIVFGSLSQPEPDEFAADQDPYTHLFVDPITHKGQYISADEEVTFTLDYIAPTNESAVGDTWTFVTTGVTAVSSAVTILGGEVNEDPRAVINATPLAAEPGEFVRFDAFESSDPNGETLSYEWDFGDGSAGASGQVVMHQFQNPGLYTVTLKATNNNSGRFGEATVDIDVFNNSPTASFNASPTSGSRPLRVEFDASDSNDQETPRTELIFEWDFGDGAMANLGRAPGTFVQTEHVYITDADGNLCTPAEPCRIEATLTVTDLGGALGAKSDTETQVIWVGNTNPVAVVSSSSLSGGDPLTVRFNAAASSDEDGQPLTARWEWGDNSNSETYDTVTGDDGLGNVSHEFTRRSGEDTSLYSVKVTVSDGVASDVKFFNVTVRAPSTTSSVPTAAFVLDPESPAVGEEFEADASASFDRPSGFPTSYNWDWGDGSPDSTGVLATHTYDESGLYTITLTVKDGESPPNEDSTIRIVNLTGQDGGDGGEGNSKPIADLSVDALEGFAGFTEFTFDASNSIDPDGDPLTYSWNFNDGSARDTREVAAHVFEEPGTYRVNLTVKDPSNAADDTFVTITVLDNTGNKNPVALIGTGPRTGTAPVTLQFDGQLSFDPDDDPIGYRWEFIRDNVLVAEGNGPVVTQLFEEAGTYSVILEVSDNRGGLDRTEPEIVSVAARQVDDEPDSPTPGEDPTGDDPAPQPFCGMGMIMGMFGSLLGLSAMRAGRRRRLM
ncbi:MAG: PKD domain-containing protein [Planctomycetota bacterium]|jgi:PKD repeat protein